MIPSVEGASFRSGLVPLDALSALRSSLPANTDRSLVNRHRSGYSGVVAFDREKMKQAAAELAAKGVFVGTSSWKYEGWFGQLYTPSRYEYRGKVAKTRFERECLRE